MIENFEKLVDQLLGINVLKADDTTKQPKTKKLKVSEN